MKKCIILFCILAICITLLAGCEPTFYYIGEHQDLAATSVYSIPGVVAYSDTKILVLDEDLQGRVLYAVLFGEVPLKERFGQYVFALVIMQKSDESHVWFYPEQNYLLKNLDKLNDKKIDVNEALVHKHFTDQRIEKLKEQNDWASTEMADDADMYCAPLNVEKEVDLPETAERAVESILGKDRIGSLLLREDDYGNGVYFVCSETYEWYAVIVNSDGSLKNGNDSIIVLGELNSIAKQLTEFLAANGWNTADSSE